MSTTLRDLAKRRSLLKGCLLFAALFAGFPQIAAAQTDVTPATLQDAIRAAGPDTVLNLAGGDYGALSLGGAHGDAPGGPLVLRSADPADPARFSAMMLRGVDGIVLEGLVFDYTFSPGDPEYLQPFQILDSRDVTVRAALFDGDMARGTGSDSDGFGTAFGLGVGGSEGIVLEGSEIRGFLRGLVVNDSRDVTVRGNDVHSLRSDGMNFAQVDTVVIAGNRIHDFALSLTSGDHPDMIQFWTNGTDAPSRNILIADNVLNSGNGLYTQSIFMRNEEVDQGRAGDEMFYRDVTIENNVIINAHLHGITVGETDGLTIRNNTVVRNATSAGPQDNVALWEPRINIAERSRDVEILRNVVRAITDAGGRADWRVVDNVLVQDRGRLEPGFYGTVFVDAALTDPRLLSSFAPRPGGPLDGTGIGAPRLDEGF